MKIGLMNNPSASVRDEIISIGKAGYDFVDMTIEGPRAFDIDIEDTLTLMSRIKTSIFDINNFVPLPGTPLYDGQNVDWKKVGFKSFENYFTNNISKEALGGYINRAYEIAQKTLENFIAAS